MNKQIFFDKIDSVLNLAIEEGCKNIKFFSKTIGKNSLAKKLLDKANEGITVNVLIADTEPNKKYIEKNFANKEADEIVNFLPVSEEIFSDGPICIVDDNLIVSGPFLSNSSKEIHQNYISLYSDNKELSLGYTNEADRLLMQYKNFTDDFQDTDSLVLKRLLEQLSKGETANKSEITKLKNRLKDDSSNLKLTSLVDAPTDTSSDINLLKQNISQFLGYSNELSIGNHSKKVQKLHINKLENNLTLVELEKLELEKQLSDFNDLQNSILGDLTKELLDEKALKSSEEEKAQVEKDRDDFNKELDELDKKQVIEVSDDEKAMLRKAYRQATTLCHPDKYENAHPDIKRKADEIFKQLNDANAANNLALVNEILEQLNEGILLNIDSTINSTFDELASQIKSLHTKIKQAIAELFDIKNDENYIFINNLHDVDDYFNSMREDLEEELAFWKNQPMPKN